MITTETFKLPTYWACYFINGDATGYTDAEIKEIDEWETMNAPGPCIGVEGNEFSIVGDDGIYVTERATFTFQVIEPQYADGEIIGYI